MPSEIGRDHPQARVGQQRDHIDVAVDVVGETVQHQHGFTICRAGRVVGDVEHPSSHRFEGSSRPRLVGDPAGGFGISILQGDVGRPYRPDLFRPSPRSELGTRFLIWLLETPPR